VRVAAVQLTSTPDKERNLATAGALIAAAADAGAELIALPELFNGWGSARELQELAEPLDGPTITWARSLARDLGVWLLAGSITEKMDRSDMRANTSCLIGPEGEIVATYRKIHLFDVAVDDGPTDTESARVTPGDRMVTAAVDGTVLGLTICYDLRFPELYRALARAGAELLTVPANFTERTGRDHWEVLLRARAIENGAYVLAPSQIGGPPGSPAFGRSMIVDPWGTVIAQAPDRVGIIRADLDLERVRAVRRQIPVLANSRPEVYGR
jgi:predicted amidohydrolase